MNIFRAARAMVDYAYIEGRCKRKLQFSKKKNKLLQGRKMFWRHHESNQARSHGVVLRGGDLEEIDDFQRKGERLHWLLSPNITGTSNLQNQFCVDLYYDFKQADICVVSTCPKIKSHVELKKWISKWVNVFVVFEAWYDVHVGLLKT